MGQEPLAGACPRAFWCRPPTLCFPCCHSTKILPCVTLCRLALLPYIWPMTFCGSQAVQRTSTLWLVFPRSIQFNQSPKISKSRHVKLEVNVWPQTKKFIKSTGPFGVRAICLCYCPPGSLCLFPCFFVNKLTKVYTNSKQAMFVCKQKTKQTNSATKRS